MSLDKAIEHKKEYRKEYYKIAPRIDITCRCHGGCQWCLGNRLYKYQKENEKTLDKIKEWEYN